jgi:putative IMPACT (imprinted ancient) family translation regulator
LIVVVRYFGGTKLGVSGLISAYKESAAAVIEEAEIIEKTVDRVFTIEFPYLVMNDVMRIIKEEQPNILSQEFDNLCTMQLSMRESRAETLLGKLRKVEGASIEEATISH